MSLGAWRYAVASVAGTSHIKNGIVCQDAGVCVVVRTSTGETTLLASVADGAGSASHADEGARLAVDSFVQEFGTICSEVGGVDRIDRSCVALWLDSLRAGISNRAATLGIPVRELSCTLLAAIVGPSRSVFFQIGDGAIVVGHASEPQDYGWVFWPQHGEFANQTNFVTLENASEVLDFDVYDGCVEELALFTDGIERLVLDLSTRTAHAPFFRPLFNWLSESGSSGSNNNATILATYLASKQINDRTDDDKTLVLATRRAIAMAQSNDDSAEDASEAGR